MRRELNIEPLAGTILYLGMQARGGPGNCLGGSRHAHVDVQHGGGAFPRAPVVTSGWWPGAGCT